MSPAGMRIRIASKMRIWINENYPENKILTNKPMFIARAYYDLRGFRVIGNDAVFPATKKQLNDFLRSEYEDKNSPVYKKSGLYKRKQKKNPDKRSWKNIESNISNKRNYAKYNAYIKSPEWSKFRKIVINHYGNRCGKCSKGDVALEVHHITYERLYNEKLEDVIPLCKQCHKQVHIDGKRNKSIYIK